MFQAAQIVGAIAILAAFGLTQFRLRRNDSYEYLGLNLVGGALLLVSAVVEEQWGFILLETAWIGIAAWGLTGRLRGVAVA